MTPELLQSIDALDTTGRDALRTNLIRQEIPFWLSKVQDGGFVEDEEVDFLIVRRGLNADEAKKFRALAVWFNTHAEELRAATSPDHKWGRYKEGFADGAGCVVHEEEVRWFSSPYYMRGFMDG